MKSLRTTFPHGMNERSENIDKKMILQLENHYFPLFPDLKKNQADLVEIQTISKNIVFS